MKAIIVDHYKMDRIETFLKREYGSIDNQDLLKKYSKMLCALELNILKVKADNPDMNSGRVLEALKIELLRIDGYIRGVCYDYRRVTNEENKKVCQALSYAYDHHSNKKIYYIVCEHYKELNKEANKEIYKVPALCIMFILNYAVNRQGWSKYDSYFKTLKEDYKGYDYLDKPMNYYLEVPSAGISVSNVVEENVELMPDDTDPDKNIIDIGSLDYLPREEYIHLFGYPIRMIDHFFLEIANISASVFFINKKDREKACEVALAAAYKSHEFLTKCDRCSMKCLDDPLDYASFDSFIESGYILSDYPESLRDENKLNFFLIEYIEEVIFGLETCFEDDMPEYERTDLLSIIKTDLLWYLECNCLSRCKEKCLLKWDSCGYCSVCKYTDKPLPCPEQGEISYKTIKVTEKEFLMCHK
jgi:hypothetical protein